MSAYIVREIELLGRGELYIGFIRLRESESSSESGAPQWTIS